MENIEQFLNRMETVLDDEDIDIIRRDMTRLIPAAALPVEEETIDIWFDDDNDEYDKYTCPICGQKIGITRGASIGLIGSHFCPRCGQALTFTNPSYTYIKRPVEVQAFCLGEDEVPHWFVQARTDGLVRYTDLEDGVDIDTPEGTMHADLGDYIIMGVKGELYPCDADSFAETYDKVEG